MTPDTPPDEPKKSLFEKLGAALPVGLTALATILAGLSTGELSLAMYWRSAAAQDQAKANDQWSLAAHKRDRALMCETTADILRTKVDTDPFNSRAIIITPPPTRTPEVVERVGAWLGGKGEPPVDDEQVRAVLQAVREHRPEQDVLQLARRVKGVSLEVEITYALAQVTGVEQQYEAELRAAKSMDWVALKQWQQAAVRYDVDSRRYKAEATANQWVGFLYEVRVKTSTAESERFRQRSENFFFAMLAAQVGGVGSSLALARKRRSALWLVAGIAGLAAVGFGAFVYLTM